MSNEERLEKLTELARKAWPGATISHEDDSISVISLFHRENGRTWTSEEIRLNPHPNAVDALEAALYVLAGEPSPEVITLSAELARQATLTERALTAGEDYQRMTREAMAIVNELLEARRG